MSLFSELKRRNIFRAGLLYIVLAWLVIEVGALAVDFLGLPGWIFRFAAALLVICFPLCLVFSWFYEITPDGLKREFNVDPEASITRQTGRRLTRIMWVGLALIILLNLARFALG